MENQDLKHSILSFVDIGDETVPSNVVLHALKQRDGKFVARIYGVEDNPKTGSDGTFLGSMLEEFMGRNRLSEPEIWDTEEHTLWTARL
ncbi:MAG TPA: hypothetical protein DCZ91_05465, partial [Lachnospiraceae bacterium]|nr:hypothetical protein [Lachnospiraceae bacterium]